MVVVLFKKYHMCSLEFEGVIKGSLTFYFTLLVCCIYPHALKSKSCENMRFLALDLNGNQTKPKGFM